MPKIKITTARDFDEVLYFVANGQLYTYEKVDGSKEGKVTHFFSPSDLGETILDLRVGICGNHTYIFVLTNKSVWSLTPHSSTNNLPLNWQRYGDFAYYTTPEFIAAKCVEMAFYDNLYFKTENGQAYRLNQEGEFISMANFGHCVSIASSDRGVILLTSKQVLQVDDEEEFLDFMKLPISDRQQSDSASFFDATNPEQLSHSDSFDDLSTDGSEAGEENELTSQLTKNPIERKPTYVMQYSLCIKGELAEDYKFGRGRREAFYSIILPQDQLDKVSVHDSVIILTDEKKKYVRTPEMFRFEPFHEESFFGARCGIVGCKDDRIFLIHNASRNVLDLEFSPQAKCDFDPVLLGCFLDHEIDETLLPERSFPVGFQLRAVVASCQVRDKLQRWRRPMFEELSRGVIPEKGKTYAEEGLFPDSYYPNEMFHQDLDKFVRHYHEVLERGLREAMMRTGFTPALGMFYTLKLEGLLVTPRQLSGTSFLRFSFWSGADKVVEGGCEFQL